MSNTCNVDEAHATRVRQQNGGVEDDRSDIYENFEYIYTKDKSFGEAKLNRSLIWFWKFRWWLSNLIMKR